MAAAKRDKATIVIRREEVVEGGHHGGAWKVAYADFVTAMMAFFLLMWLINATTEAQRKGLADYFSPNSVISSNRSGFGKPFGGTTPNVNGSLASDNGAVRIVEAKPRPYVDAADEGDGPAATEATAGTTHEPGAGSGKGQATRPYRSAAQLSAQQQAALTAAEQKAQHAAAQAAQERAAFEQAAQQIRDQVRSDPALAGLGHQLAVDITPQGLRVQILDAENRPMFATGSAAPNDWARAVLAKVTPALLRLPEPVSIAGYTDAQPYHGGERTNWDLSADRANATRRLLAEAGLPDSRLQSVTGHADREPLLPADPLAAANRRIAIVVLRQAPQAPQGAAPQGIPPQAAAPLITASQGNGQDAADAPAR